MVKLNDLYVMRRILAITIALAVSFVLCYATNDKITNKSEGEKKMKRVTSIGGIFFKCKDPAKMNDWYRDRLGLQTNQYGSVFEWRQAEDSTKKGFTQWSPFKESTKYFAPSEKEFMINYRVADLEALVEELKKEGVTILDSIETYEYGKFVHIMDPEGNKIELWEPNDEAYEKMGVEMNLKTTK